MLNEERLRLWSPGQNALRIVAVGGGHGLSNMLRGLKLITRNLTAVVTVADDGGGSGQLRRELGMPPPGDIRSCISALSNSEPIMTQLLDYRFSDGSLSGQSFGNLFLAALNSISGSFEEAVRSLSNILAITGRVLPVTSENINLIAEFENGQTVKGESSIFQAKKYSGSRIAKVRLEPDSPRANPECLEAIRQAELIVLGPGSLYTSIIPNLLVSGISEAIKNSTAPRILVMNIMTQDGETEGYTASDHLRALLAHGGEGLVDAVLLNSSPVSETMRRCYAAEDAEPLLADVEALQEMGVHIFQAPLLADEQFASHAPVKLANALIDAYRVLTSSGKRTASISEPV